MALSKLKFKLHIAVLAVSASANKKTNEAVEALANFAQDTLVNSLYKLDDKQDAARAATYKEIERISDEYEKRAKSLAKAAAELPEKRRQAVEQAWEQGKINV